MLIGEGGLLRQVEARCHLTQTKAQILVAVACTWVPLMVFGLIAEYTGGRRLGIVHDTAVHVRLLVAMPLILFLDSVFPVACTQAADLLIGDSFVPSHQLPRLEKLLTRIRVLCERWWPELVLALIALAVGLTMPMLRAPDGSLAIVEGMTLADWWYCIIAFPLYQFLILRALWRWLIWVRFLLGVSRLDLDLDATHPDRGAGISFLRKPSIAYCALMVSAISAVVSGGWSERFQLSTLTSFLPFLVGLAAFAVLAAFGPLLVFSPALQRARFTARETLGSLAIRNGRWFRDRWLNSQAGEAIASSEVQSLSAIVSVYRETLEHTSLILFGKKDLVVVLLAALAPVVPTMLLRIPHDEWMFMTSFVFSKATLP